ncbi:MAG: GntG family PLP-dependent aldolase [Holophaga sp.]|nr:GntG family PLP-dependent aldolase [Holophaga sp.]
MPTQTIHFHGPTRTVDLRSDTVTRPTKAMYERMLTAPIGDDALDRDPSVVELEEYISSMLGKSNGLFVPSCTMANLLAVLSTSERNEQVFMESSSHMYNSERGSATFTGVFYQGVPGTAGAMDLSILNDLLKPSSLGLNTSLIAMETTHNNAGGKVLEVSHMESLYALASANGILVHLDGARFFNATTHLGIAPEQLARFADTVSICLSKGLSAPVGAVLTGPRRIIEKARKIRRMLGGTQRQAGVMAAAGLEAVQVMRLRLAEDHARAQMFSKAVNALSPILSASMPETNIVQVELSNTSRDSSQWTEDLEKFGLLVRPLGKARLRCVTHRHIEDEDIQLAAIAFKNVLKIYHLC